MKIKYMLSSLLLSLTVSVHAQECVMPISIELDEDFTNVPAAARTVLYQSLSRLATESGLTSESPLTPFILTVHCDVLDKSNHPGPPIQTVYNLGMTFYMADTYTQKKFGTAYITLNGVGTGEVKSYINAFRGISAGNAEIKNLINRGGKIFNTGTPWHVDDAFQLMPEPERWPWDKTGLMTQEQYDEIAKVTTPSLLAANYQLRHIPSDDVIFTDPKTGASHEKVYHGICHVDAAYGGEDYTAFTAMQYEDGTYYVYGRVWRKHVSDVANLIKADHTRLMLGKLHIETNGDKGFMARDFKNMDIPVVPYNETMNKILKIETYLKQAWPSIVFVDGTDQEFINQICDWTEEAEHDDCPDSAASLCRVLSARKRNEGYKSRLY